MGILSFALPSLPCSIAKFDPSELTTAVRGLVGLVLLFDLYTIYQQLQIFRIRRQLAEREELFRLISENAADMIALVDAKGQRLYNSPAYLPNSWAFSRGAEELLAFRAGSSRRSSHARRSRPRSVSRWPRPQD